MSIAQWKENAIRKYLGKLPAGKGEGQHRDDDGYTFACFLKREMDLDDSEAMPWMEEWDSRNGVPKGPEELQKLLTNGKKYGKNQPKTGPAHVRFGAARSGSNGTSTHANDDGELITVFDIVNLTDTGNARRVLKNHGQDMRYCHPTRLWHIWDGSRWKEDDTAESIRRVKDTQGRLYFWVLDKLKEATARDEKDRLEEFLNHVIRWEDVGPTAACLKSAQSEPGVPILPLQMDADPYLLNTTFGTIDLRSGQLRPHRREDLITKLAPVEWNIGALCPLWERVLDKIMDSNKEMISYLQRAVGYSLTGDVSEQCLFFLYGAGANGKSTFLSVLLGMLGDYGCQSVSELLLAKNTEAHPTERADLAGRRFVCTIETDEGKQMAEAFTKQLTGGDIIKARRMRQDFIDIRPTWKIWLAANHRPVIRGQDLAIWRRIKLIPFAVTIPDKDKDKHLVEKLKAEWPGILAWAVRGCLDWQRNGLGEPKEVQEATKAYQAEQDLLAKFLEECCYQHESVRVQAGPLLDAYVRWSSDKYMNPTAFAAKLKAKGFTSDTGTGGRKFYKGIGLTDSPPQGS